MQYLLPLFDAYSFAVPADTAAGLVILPDTLEEIYQTNVTAEVRNIEMYEALLKQDGLPEDVEDVFEALKRASENHLAAFQRNLDKPGDGQAQPDRKIRPARFGGHADFPSGSTPKTRFSLIYQRFPAFCTPPPLK